jgi:hypothetical protein
MIRRSTLVVVALFAIALIALYLVQRNPGLLPSSATPSPQATPMSKLFTDWKDSDVIEAKLERAIGGTTDLTRNPDGSWTNVEVGAVPPGKVEQLLSELLATNILVTLPPDTALADLKLADPGQKVTLRSADGRETVILVGGLTPTSSGYYIKVDAQAPVAVSKYAIEAVFQLFDEAKPEPTPTPTS